MGADLGPNTRTGEADARLRSTPEMAIFSDFLSIIQETIEIG
jgi:hypothetical protein